MIVVVIEQSPVIQARAPWPRLLSCVVEPRPVIVVIADGTPPTPPADPALLLESGDALLLESGDRILLE